MCAQTSPETKIGISGHMSSTSKRVGCTFSCKILITSVGLHCTYMAASCEMMFLAPIASRSPQQEKALAPSELIEVQSCWCYYSLPCQGRLWQTWKTVARSLATLRSLLDNMKSLHILKANCTIILPRPIRRLCRSYITPQATQCIAHQSTPA